MLSYYVLRSEFRIVMSVAIFAKNDDRLIFISSCLQEDACLIYVFLCLFTYSGVQHILCCVFVLFLVYTMLPVSLNCAFLIASSVFSNIYAQ